MKVLLNILIVIFLLIAVNVSAQQGQSGKIVVDKSLLTPEQITQAENQAKLDEVKTTVEQAGEWVGLGKEIGSAVDGALSALTDRTDQFAQTDVGKFTMFIVAYKIIGTDMVQFLIGIPLFFVIILIFIWLVRRNCMKRRYLVREVVAENGEVSREWDETDLDTDMLWGHLVGFLICSFFCTLVLFL